MNSTTKGVISVLVVGVVVYIAYWKFYGQKHKYAKTIIDSGNYSSGMAELHKFETPFLKDWAEAVKSSSPTFMHKGKLISTKGGSSVK
jgi:hypothetical protein